MGSQSESECFQFNGRAVLSLKLVQLKARRLLVGRSHISNESNLVQNTTTNEGVPTPVSSEIWAEVREGMLDGK